MALNRLDSNSTSRTLGWFVMNQEEIDLNPPYQRGVVWGVERQRALLKSILSEYPIPAIIVNDRFGAQFAHEGYTRDQCWIHVVIDGKQRITAMREFVAGNITVPAEWYPENQISDEAKGKTDITYPELTLAGQRFFKQRSVPVCEAKVATLAEEAEIFETINNAGLAQGESDF
jgi:hypothetical protein